MLFDSHSHPHFNAFKNDSDEVIKRALKSGVEMVVVGTQIDTSRNSVTTADKFSGVWAAIGLHPSHLEEGYVDDNEVSFKRRAEVYDKEIYKQLALSSKKVVAIGEIGLDYYRLEGDDVRQQEIINKQKEVFEQQLALATELDLPVSVHCRDAYEDVFQILRKTQSEHSNLRGVMHCFVGTEDEAKKFLDLGFYISFSGIITFAKSWDEFIKNNSLDKFLVETDCPYLTPVPNRGKRNEPVYVEYTARHMAKLKGLSFEEVASITARNAKKLFGIDFINN